MQRWEEKAGIIIFLLQTSTLSTHLRFFSFHENHLITCTQIYNLLGALTWTSSFPSRYLCTAVLFCYHWKDSKPAIDIEWPNYFSRTYESNYLKSTDAYNPSSTNFFRSSWHLNRDMNGFHPGRKHMPWNFSYKFVSTPWRKAWFDRDSWKIL